MPTCPRCRKVYPEDARVCGDDGEKLLPDEAFSNTERDLPAGYVVGEYRIETKLGEGGFGSVYRAVHPLIGKTAAIKVLNRQWSSNPQMVSRFIAEARAVNQIRHRNIIDIFSFGALEDGRQYYVMELLEGMTMDAFLAQHGRLPPADAIPILRQVARALDAAHAAGIAHRDLKPENVFLQMDDGAVFPKLLDFGIAKLLTDSSGAHKTRTGTPMGTPHYMSPEQCRGKDVDHRTDIYSFGVMVHKTLTGQLPFDGEEVLDILVKQTGTPAPRMSEVLPGLAPELDGPVLHMLEKDPGRRPPSLTVAVDELAACARVAVPTSGGTSSPQVGGGARSGGSGMTPAELGALVEARTVVGDVTPPRVSPTLLGSTADTQAEKKRTSPAVLVGIAAALLAVVAGVVLVSTRGDARRGRRVHTPAVVVDRNGDVVVGAAGAPPVPAPAPAASSAPVVAPAAAVTEVEITLQSTPPGADVFLGATKLGTTPGPFRVKRGDDKIKLTLKADGHKPTDVELTPTANVTLPVTLPKVVAGPRRKAPGELENPF